MAKTIDIAGVAATLALTAWAALPAAPGTGSVHAATRITPAAASLPGRVAQQTAQDLTPGCNLITLAGLPVGSPVADYVAQHVAAPDLVTGIWHFDNPSQRYVAVYFPDPQAPVQQATFTSNTDAFFVCVSGSTTLS